jgi:type I restriction enzyme M protein
MSYKYNDFNLNNQDTEDDYKSCELDEKVLKILGYPYTNPNIVKRNKTYKSYNTTYRVDYIFYINDIPSLIIEAKKNDKELDFGFEEGSTHTVLFNKNRRIPYLIVSAGKNIKMYKTLISKDGHEVVYEDLGYILTWKELIEKINNTFNPKTIDNIRESSVAADVIADTLFNIFKIIKSIKRPNYSYDDAILILNKLILSNFYNKNNYNDIYNEFIIPKKYIKEIDEIIKQYDLSKAHSNELAYIYREFVTDYFRGYSQSDIFSYDIGRYITPRELIDFMVKISDINPSYKVIDPACGSGGFLAGVLSGIPNYEKINFIQNNLYGCDIDPFCVSTAKTFIGFNVSSEKLISTNIFKHNGLYCNNYENTDYGKQDNICNFIKEGTFDLVISNPPGNSGYSVGFDKEFVSKKLNLEGSFVDSEAFINRAIQLTNKNGKICLIIPGSFLANLQKQDFRDSIFINCYPKAIISLPRDIFPNVSSKMAIILLEKGIKYSKNYPIFMASIELDEEHPSLEAELDNVYKEYIEFNK